MKLHAINGVVEYGGKNFLPAIKGSEYEIEEHTFQESFVKLDGQSYMPKGKYRKVTALVKVTRYYKI